MSVDWQMVLVYFLLGGSLFFVGRRMVNTWRPKPTKICGGTCCKT